MSKMEVTKDELKALIHQELQGEREERKSEKVENEAKFQKVEKKYTKLENEMKEEKKRHEEEKKGFEEEKKRHEEEKKGFERKIKEIFEEHKDEIKALTEKHNLEKGALQQNLNNLSNKCEILLLENTSQKERLAELINDQQFSKSGKDSTSTTDDKDKAFVRQVIAGAEATAALACGVVTVVACVKGACIIAVIATAGTVMLGPDAIKRIIAEISSSHDHQD